MNAKAIPAIFTRYASTADKGVRATFETNELDSEEQSYLISLKGQFGYLVFVPKEKDPNAVEIPDYVPDFKGEKSPASRLRSVLYRVWETTDKTISSEQFYREKMEEIIIHMKKKLD
jgi:hypothetical protein